MCVPGGNIKCDNEAKEESVENDGGGELSNSETIGEGVAPLCEEPVAEVGILSFVESVDAGGPG